MTDIVANNSKFARQAWLRALERTASIDRDPSVTLPVLDAQLADIVTHGFRITTLYDSPTTVWDAVAERP